jgi:hypothetical protein
LFVSGWKIVFLGMDLNEFDCQLLDEVLALLSRQDRLSQDQFLEMFDNDDAYAAAMLDVLVKNGLVTTAGNAIGSDLPLVINREPAAVLFLQNGGFLKSFGLLLKKEQSDADQEDLQKRNLQLQNESLEYQMSLRERDEQIKMLELKIRRFEYLKYLLWAAGLVTSGLGIWVYQLLHDIAHMHFSAK